MLADRAVCAGPDWLSEQPELIETLRTWIAWAPSGRRFRWTEIDDLGRELNLPVRGKNEGEKDFPDFKAAVRALRVIRALIDDVAAVVLIRDMDDQEDRERGLRQARDRHEQQGGSFRVVLGVANPKRECWVLAGFDPFNEQERRLLEEERSYLGFGPVERSEQLTAKHHEDKRSAKRVLEKLTQGNWQREKQCWTVTQLDTMRSRGQKNGLASYLKEVEDRLVPLVLSTK